MVRKSKRSVALFLTLVLSFHPAVADAQSSAQIEANKGVLKLSPTAQLPSPCRQGQLWFDTTTNTPKSCNDGTTWSAIGGGGSGITINTTTITGGSNGNVLYNNSGTVGEYAQVPVAEGGTGVASLTAYAPLFGGTTTTNPVQSGAVGTAGQVLTSNGAAAIATFQDNPGANTCTVFVAGADYTNSTTSPTDVTGLVCALAINSRYRVECMLSVDSAASTTGQGFSFTLPAGASVVGSFMGNNASSGGVAKISLTTGNASTGTNPTTLYPVEIFGTITTAGTAGNAQLQAMSEIAASQIDVNIGSNCIFRKIQ